MMELPDLHEILQKHKIKYKSIKNKDFNAKETTKAVVITVKDYDKKSINQVLKNQGQKVGVVVLVNGKPAIIKKRKTHPEHFLKKKLHTHKNTNEAIISLEKSLVESC